MKARITDSAALSGVKPFTMATYLRTHGWIAAGPYGDAAAVWIDAAKREVIVPEDEQVVDYASAVASFLTIVAEAEERDELQLYRDLLSVDRDTIRVRSLQAAEDGSVSLKAGVALFAEARSLLEAAACAAHEPKRAYRAGGIREAQEFMSEVRLGQTEQGSYVITLLAPVPPLLAPAQPGFWPDLEDEPFERLVTRKLVDGLQAAHKAVRGAMQTNTVTPFEAVVRDGVNANLCDALAGLIEQGDGVDVSVTWAATRPAPKERQVIRFSRAEAPIFREAAKEFRSREPRPAERLEGYVGNLHRGQSEDTGQIRLRTFVDGKPVTVVATLNPEVYDIAIKAHRDKTAVAISGELVRRGQRWHLDSPQGLELLPEEDESAN